MKVTEFKKLIREEVKKVLKEDNSKYQDALDTLLHLISTGAVTKDEFDEISFEIKKARNKYNASKRSPESYKSAAEKAKRTRMQSAKEKEKWDKEWDTNRSAQEREAERRYKAGKLPLQTDDYFFKIDTQYYDYIATNPNGGYKEYRLKPAYHNTKVPTSVLKKYWGK